MKLQSHLPSILSLTKTCAITTVKNNFMNKRYYTFFVNKYIEPFPKNRRSCDLLLIFEIHDFDSSIRTIDLHGLKPHGGAGHSHTGRALCAVVAERRLHVFWNTPVFSKTAVPHINHTMGLEGMKVARAN